MTCLERAAHERTSVDVLVQLLIPTCKSHLFSFVSVNFFLGDRD